MHFVRLNGLSLLVPRRPTEKSRLPEPALLCRSRQPLQRVSSTQAFLSASAVKQPLVETPPINQVGDAEKWKKTRAD
jgi:hypothetical protein